MANLDKKSGDGFNIDKIIDFCKTNVKYISASAVTIALVIFLGVTAANSSNNKDKVNTNTNTNTNTEAASQEGEETNDDAENNSSKNATEPVEDTAEDEHPEITKLLSTYYNSYAAGDLEQLSSIAKEISDMEKDYIKMLNEHVESYGNVSCTVADGASEGAYIVSVVYDMKFAGVEETLPGMNVFYLQTDENGELYIDNPYSSFNRELNEQEMDENIITLMEEFEDSDAVKKLQQDVQSEYEKKVAANEELQKKLSEVADAIENWKDSYTPSEEGETEEPEEPTEDEQQPEEPTEDEQQPEEPTGDEQQPEETDEGNTDEGSADDGNSSGVNYVPEGKTLTASASYNVRKAMDETSEIVGTTAAGDSITVVLSYAEGWTKVEWNGTTGYIRTDLLLDN